MMSGASFNRYSTNQKTGFDPRNMSAANYNELGSALILSVALL